MPAHLQHGSPTTIGEKAPLRLDIEPVAAFGGSFGDRLRFNARVSTHFAGDGSASLAHYIVDSESNVVRAPVSSEPRAVERDAAIGETVESPEQLDDGLYQIRVLAVAFGEITAGQEADSAISAQQSAFFRVTDGQAEPSSADEWYRSPEVRHIHSIADGFTEPLSAYEDYEDYRKNREAHIQMMLRNREK